jgi:hypothetical protein
VLYTPEGIASELPDLEIANAERLTRTAGEAEAVDTLVTARARP